MRNSSTPKKPRKINYREHEAPETGEYPDISNVASANECTGLMYSTPRNEEELENYQELSSMAIPRQEAKKPRETTD